MSTKTDAALDDVHPAVEVRPMAPHERDAVRALHRGAFGPETAFDDVGLERLFVHERAVNLVAVLDPTGPPVGFAAALHGGRDEAHLWTLHVASAARRRGVARALLDELVRRLNARGARRLTLSVHVDNGAAQALYEAAGFRCVGDEADAYPGLEPPTGLTYELAL